MRTLFNSLSSLSFKNKVERRDVCCGINERQGPISLCASSGGMAQASQEPISKIKFISALSRMNLRFCCVFPFTRKNTTPVGTTPVGHRRWKAREGMQGSIAGGGILQVWGHKSHQCIILHKASIVWENAIVLAHEYMSLPHNTPSPPSHCPNYLTLINL